VLYIISNIVVHLPLLQTAASTPATKVGFVASCIFAVVMWHVAKIKKSWNREDQERVST
jgi:hypothetical protein